MGTIIGDRLPRRLQETVFHSLGLVTIVIGVNAALEAFRPALADLTRASLLIVMGSVLVGGIIGELLGVERGLNRLGDGLKARFAQGQARFTEGFVMASLVFCVGPLTVLGSIEDGLTGDYQLLAVKSLLDGFAAVAFASALGWGVGFSAIVVLVYQGALTLSASWAAGVLSEAMIAAMTAAGGVLILGIGLRLLKLLDVRVANLLPALVLAPVSIAIVERFA